jgi:hypothetical protein
MYIAQTVLVTQITVQPVKLVISQSVESVLPVYLIALPAIVLHLVRLVLQVTLTWMVTAQPALIQIVHPVLLRPEPALLALQITLSRIPLAS